jgi:hypothetical protein
MYINICTKMLSLALCRKRRILHIFSKFLGKLPYKVVFKLGGVWWSQIAHVELNFIIDHLLETSIVKATISRL